jgi:amino-acid N-acetyltransferase
LACHSSIRITDSQELRLIEEETGYVRIEIERQLNRCLRLHGGFVPHEPGVTPPPNGNVVGGNFYSAMAFGQRDGVDYKNSGFPCHVQTEKIRQSLDNNDILLLTGVGMSRMGEMLSVNTEALAAFVAGEIQASKVVYFSTKGMLLRNKSTKNSVQNFQLSFATSLLDHYKIRMHKKGYASVNGQTTPDEDGVMNDHGISKDNLDLLLKIGWAASALKRGVQRAHIIGPNDGDLLTELFTACDGKSTCISPDGFRSIHPDDEFDDTGDFDGTFFQDLVDGNPPYS